MQFLDRFRSSPSIPYTPYAKTRVTFDQSFNTLPDTQSQAVSHQV